MGWKTIVISNPCRLSTKDNNLVLSRHEQEDVKIPINDLSSIVVESSQCTLTSSLLSKLSSEGVAVYVCDETHMPNGLLAPFGTHSRHTKTARVQAAWSEPFKKRIWQSIIKTKITNQAEVLHRADSRKSARELKSIASVVSSGDVGNREAQAANVYWKGLFDDFVRGGMCKRNSALNYGYAILRGAVARSICASGFVPALGVFHDNQLNAFNLADDVIEPFRPFVDMLVWELFRDDKEPGILTRDDKMELTSLLNSWCSIGGRNETIVNACDVVTSSLMICSFTKNSKGFLLPSRSDKT